MPLKKEMKQVSVNSLTTVILSEKNTILLFLKKPFLLKLLKLLMNLSPPSSI
jgi:hypothetical protein